MATTPRRWFRYSLRTLFVVMTLFACWLGYYGHWRYQRMVAREWIALRTILKKPVRHPLALTLPTLPLPPPLFGATSSLPLPLRLLRESPEPSIYVRETRSESHTDFMRRIDEIHSLFPEADIRVTLRESVIEGFADPNPNLPGTT